MVCESRKSEELQGGGLQPLEGLSLDDVVKRIRQCLPSQEGLYALHEPVFAGNEWKYVKECLDTGWVSSVGKFVDSFESGLAEYTGVGRAVAVVNGTAALHMCLKLVGVEENDEVLVPAMTFVATANAVTYCGAVPHFVDSEMRTLGVCPEKLGSYLRENGIRRKEGTFNKETGRRIRALVVMHALGHPADLDGIAAVCHEFGIELVEDAAESIGSLYKGRHTGQWGKVSALSFNGNKSMTTGGGGAILTNDQSIADIAKHLTTTAKIPHKWNYDHDQIGYNYRLPNLNAALGCAQLEQLSGFVAKKRKLADRYRAAFAGLDGIKFFAEPEFATSNYWLNALILEDSESSKLEALLELTHESGIATRPVWTLMHRLPMFATAPRMDLSTAENIARRLITIPSGPAL